MRWSWERVSTLPHRCSQKISPDRVPGLIDVIYFISQFLLEDGDNLEIDSRGLRSQPYSDTGNPSLNTRMKTERNKSRRAQSALKDLVI